MNESRRNKERKVDRSMPGVACRKPGQRERERERDVAWGRDVKMKSRIS